MFAHAISRKGAGMLADLHISLGTGLLSDSNADKLSSKL